MAVAADVVAAAVSAAAAAAPVVAGKGFGCGVCVPAAPAFAAADGVEE